MLLVFSADIFAYRHVSGSRTGNVTIIVTAGIANEPQQSGTDTQVLGGIVNPQVAAGIVESGTTGGAVQTVTASGLEL